MGDGSPLIILAPCPEQRKGGLQLPFQFPTLKLNDRTTTGDDKSVGLSIYGAVMATVFVIRSCGTKSQINDDRTYKSQVCKTTSPYRPLRKT